jgi:hypothetical protein
MPGGSAKVRLYLPAGYATDPASTTYPVLLLLHGAGAASDPDVEAGYTSWSRTRQRRGLADKYKVIVVMPEGLRYGLYADWLNASNGFTPKLQTFHLSQVLRWSGRAAGRRPCRRSPACRPAGSARTTTRTSTRVPASGPSRRSAATWTCSARSRWASGPAPGSRRACS